MPNLLGKRIADPNETIPDSLSGVGEATIDLFGRPPARRTRGDGRPSERESDNLEAVRVAGDSQVLSADESLPEGSIDDSADCRSFRLHFDSGPI
jgi:hypothetical protein